jgi:hypothetical protein
MQEFSLLQTTTAFVIGILVFILVTLSYWAGNRLRIRAIKRDPAHVKTDVKTINGMLIGLLGLLLAFTFSMANSRYDDRRKLIIQEANIIGTTVLRTDMYPDSVRAVFRSVLKGYVESRIAYYDAGSDIEKAITEFRNAQVLSSKLWRMVTDYSKINESTTRTSQLIQALNDMIDITTTRLSASEGTIPDSILYFLFVLSACTSFLMGYDQGSKIEWLIVVGFSLALSATIFSIVDLDRPRSGLINLNNPNQKIIELRDMFTE